jgi:hypothetical protein
MVEWETGLTSSTRTEANRVLVTAGLIWKTWISPQLTIIRLF